MDWYRVHHDTCFDMKLSMIAKKAGARRCEMTAVWECLLNHASQHPDRGSLDGLDPDIITFSQEIDPDIVTAILCGLEEKGVIADGRIANWDKRQPSADAKHDTTSSERVRRHRARKKQETSGNGETENGASCHADETHETPCNGNETVGNGDVTVASRACHGGVTVPDTDSDTEKENSVPIGTGRAPPATAPPVGVVKSIFDVGVSLLASGGVKERQARSLIGKWRKGYGDVALFEALQAAEREGATEPVAFIEACLRQPGRSLPGGYDPLAAKARAIEALEELNREWEARDAEQHTDA